MQHIEGIEFRDAIEWAIVEGDTACIAYKLAKEINPKLKATKCYFILRANSWHTLEDIAGYVNPALRDKSAIDVPSKKRAASIYALSDRKYFVFIDNDVFPTPSFSFDYKRAQTVLKRAIHAHENGGLEDKNIYELRMLSNILKTFIQREADSKALNKKEQDPKE